MHKRRVRSVKREEVRCEKKGACKAEARRGEGQSWWNNRFPADRNRSC